jgi:adenylate cyclase
MDDPPKRMAGGLPAGSRRSLFSKYLVTLFVAVTALLLLGAVSDAWFGYRDQRATLSNLLRTESRSAADRIQTFIDNIREQLGWVLQLPWTDGDDQRHVIDALRLLRQVPAISSIRLIDASQTERAFVSRLGLNRTGRGDNLSNDPAAVGAQRDKVWFGPVRYERGSEPYMTIAVSGNGASAGIVVADINLKLIWEVISDVKIGDTGQAFVIDDSGRLIAHPNISLVLQGETTPGGFGRLAASVVDSGGAAAVTRDTDGREVIATATRLHDPGWTVIAQQPTQEAFASIRTSLWRSLGLIVIGALLALSLAWWLARRISGPILELEEGVRLVGAGQFDHRITISTGDELEKLANSFNDMAAELGASKEKSDRISRLKRFLAPQVAELVEISGNQALLSGQRRDVVAIFGDLRGFTAFSVDTAPEILMRVLGEYYAALGAVIAAHQATLVGFDGDGLMVLVNAPIECSEPAVRGLRLAIDMQSAAQQLIVNWRAAGHRIGFGVGAAMGPATVGTVGYEGRLDYTAIGSVINLASRLCGSADDGQILLDAVLAGSADGVTAVSCVGEQVIKGYGKPVQVFSIP